ncbi:MAG: replication initiator protein [Microviridae sp.]|nr:MAG: replication initiator protein [Microviridae sp.]
MACFHPIDAYKCEDGSIVFAERAKFRITGHVKLPCGQCAGCRIDRAREWTIRCMHEASCHEKNSFVTLTYSDENIPAGNTLVYEDFQLWIKRLRKHTQTPLRYFMCGEYGSQTERPHYHALIFGYQFPDLQPWGITPQGHQTYRSATLEKLWWQGNSLIGQVTKQAAGYIARYSLKKVTGNLADAHYNGRTPEFARMSLKPGIGATWFDKYKSDCLPCDYIIHDGIKMPVPRYYENLYTRKGGDIDPIKESRESYAVKYKDNQTWQRMEVREEVLHAKIKQLKRTL